MPYEKKPKISTTSDRVTVESIRVVGYKGPSSKLARAAFDIEPGESTTRERLSEIVRIGEERLRGFASYRRVDVALRKGTRRQSYAIVVTVEPIDTLYAGGALTVRQWRQHGRSPFFDSDAEQRDFDRKALVYTGSRNFMETGLHLDLSVERRLGSEAHKGDDEERHEDRRDDQTLLYVYKQGVGHPRLFAVGALGYIDGEADGGTRGGGSNFSTNVYYSYRLLMLGLGYRSGFWSIASIAYRGVVKGGIDFRFESSSDELQFADINRKIDDISSGASIQGQYSEKTGLSVVEAGAVHRLTYSRYWSHDYFQPILTVSSRNTFLFGQGHALTPVAIYGWDWLRTSESTLRYTRKFEVGLTYEKVMHENFVLSFGHGVMGYHNHDGDDADDLLPARKSEVSLKYANPAFIGSLTFIYGYHSDMNDGEIASQNVEANR